VADGSSIEWTEATWNPVTGCTKISAGCKFCYAERMSLRLQAMGKSHYATGFRLAMHDDALTIPYGWKSSRVIFVNSMSDLFHEDVPLEFIKRVFSVMNDCAHHTFQILTKRPHSARRYATELTWSPNIWMGTSVEDRRVLHRIKDLVKIPASTRFLSVEPLLGPLPRLPLQGIDWVIVGGESGPGSRHLDPDWVRVIRDRCITRGVPFFFKQWGGTNKKAAGRLLDGREWNEMPERSQHGRHTPHGLDRRAAHSRQTRNSEDLFRGLGSHPGAVAVDSGRRTVIR
jgi:protein gp37